MKESSNKQQLIETIEKKMDELAKHFVKNSRIKFNVVYNIDNLKNSVLAINHSFLKEIGIWNIVTLFHRYGPGENLSGLDDHPGHWAGDAVISFMDIDFHLVYQYQESEIQAPKGRIWKPRITPKQEAEIRRQL